MENDRSGHLASRLSVASIRIQAAASADLGRQEEDAKAKQQQQLNSAAFWLLGLLNNSGEH